MKVILHDLDSRYDEMIPSLIFILFADVFFIIISLFEGGIFRGWLAKKELERMV